MNVAKLAVILQGKVVVDGGHSGFVEGYCGDLLSYCMGRAVEGGVWFTIMNNINVAAVAQLTDVAVVVICDCVMPEGNLIRKMSAQGISLVCTPLPVYESAVLFHDNLQK